MSEGSKYQSPFSVGKRQTVFIDPLDPRVRGWKAGITAARLGAELEIVDASSLSQAGTFSYLKNSTSTFSSFSKGFDPSITDSADIPGSISNLSASWTGSDLIITFDFDFSNEQNQYVTSFGYYLTGNSIKTPFIESKTLNTSSVSQTVIFSFSDNTKYYGEFQDCFTLLEIAAYDSFGKSGEVEELSVIPCYVPDLCIPTITATSIIMGYSVNFTEVCNKPYQYVSVEEIVSDASTAPSSGYQQVYLSSLRPAVITTPTTEARWIKARYTDGAGKYGSYSNAVKVTPTNPISVDITPPSEVVSASAVWSGDNIVVSYTLPANDAGVRFKIALTAPNSSIGYFYFFPVIGSLNQTAIISKGDLFTQFGDYYSSYSGLIKSIDASDNQSAGVSFSVAARANPLVGVTPTFSTTALVNGYNVSFDLPLGASYAEVYQKYTSWSGVTPVDSFTGSYSSGGSPGTNTVTLSGVVSNKGISVSPLAGYRVIGNGIPNNSYITSVSGSEITINNNFTSQVSGSVTGYAVVYSGSSPANISSTLYQNTYLIIRYYDDFGNSSNYSLEQIVIPLSPVTVDTTGPGNVAAVNTPTSGIDTTGTLGFNGFINLTWNAVTDTTLRGYRIRFTTDSSSPTYSYVDYPIDQTNPPTGTLSYRLIGLAVGATYKIGIATYDDYNNISSSYINFSDVTITGTPAITDYITAGNFQFGQGVDANNITNTGSGTKRGLFLDASNYWFLNASNSARLKVGGTANNYILWDGANFAIDGNITARGGSFSGNIALTTIGASIYNGDVTTSPGNLTGDGFIFNKDGLLIRKGNNQVSLDTTNGAITANNGNIADWAISSSKIEKLDATSGKYSGLSSTGLYKFWSGSTNIGGDTTQFAVDRTGKVFASNVQISGGSLDVGPAAPNGFHVNSSGNLTAGNATLSGAITATSGSIEGNFRVVSGSFYTGSSPTANTVIINTAGLGALNSSGATLTAILNTPISTGNIPIGDNPSVGNTLPTAITFFTKAALIGGWVVDSEKIYDREAQFNINSTTKTLSIFGSVTGTNYGLKISSSANNFVEAGTRDLSNNIPNPSFYVTKAGILNANGAIITGKITSQEGQIGGWSIGNTILTATSLTLNSNGSILTGGTGTARVKIDGPGSSILFVDPTTESTVYGSIYTFNNGNELIIQRGDKVNLGYAASTGFISVSSGGVTIGRTNSLGVQVGALNVGTTTATFNGVSVATSLGGSLAFPSFRNISAGTGSKTSSDTDGLLGDIWIQYA